MNTKIRWFTVEWLIYGIDPDEPHTPGQPRFPKWHTRKIHVRAWTADDAITQSQINARAEHTHSQRLTKSSLHGCYPSGPELFGGTR